MNPIYIIYTRLLFLAVFSICIAFSLFGQKSWIEASAKSIFSKPIANIDANHFTISFGFGGNVLKGWRLKNGYSVSSGIFLNRLAFKEIIPHLVFGLDIINGTTSSYKRTLSFIELGGLAKIEKELKTNEKNILSPSLGIGFSRMFGDQEYKKTMGSGPDTFEQGEFEISKYSLNLFIGIKYEWNLSNNNLIGIQPNFTYRFGKVSSSDILASSQFNPNTLAIEFSLKHILK